MARNKKIRVNQLIDKLAECLCDEKLNYNVTHDDISKCLCGWVIDEEEYGDLIRNKKATCKLM